MIDTTVPATDRQTSYLTVLLADRDASVLSADMSVLASKRLTGGSLSKREASALISALLSAPRVRAAAATEAAPAASLPEPGFYAIDNLRGVLAFYVVREGTGRWAGRRFLNLYKSDELLRPSRVDIEHFANAMSDPDAREAAQLAFARETTRCYRCGRRLTDAESRARGIGPHCVTV